MIPLYISLFLDEDRFDESTNRHICTIPGIPDSASSSSSGWNSAESVGIHVKSLGFVARVGRALGSSRVEPIQRYAASTSLRGKTPWMPSENLMRALVLLVRRIVKMGLLTMRLIAPAPQSSRVRIQVLSIIASTNFSGVSSESSDSSESGGCRICNAW
jgi:hypothetical protein